MLKRLRWMLIGAIFGTGLWVWLSRVIRQTMQRYTPSRLSSGVSGAVRSLPRDVGLAVAEGREAMRERERVLRAQLEARNGPGPAPGAPRGRLSPVRQAGAAEAAQRSQR